MAENLKLKPSKGILKNSSSFDVPDKQSKPKKAKGGAKWDEMNILATLHPPDKDYGHMKIDEPKTPYNYENSSEDIDVLDAADLAERIRLGAATKPKVLQPSDDDEEEDDDLTEEERLQKKDFENKRKKHYNEFYAVKLARKLLEEEEDDDEEDPQKACIPTSPNCNASSSSKVKK
ncbi:PREDICTED: protein phosphatase inhibitor 2 [Nicrophorus vespilloides]|uniref:Protein phosphatase inhibitor 2 n=1 Tax=Nicrophorus vespilloides TaxID=110193 RepID=A0ABM1MIT4_NICVS|nr:PREDICTED: protein phosphatase inhibitor 2 [Nicrophorus vespilloides]